MKNTTSSPCGPKPKKFFTPSRIIIYSVLFIAAVYYLIPLYIMIVTSLKGMPEIRMGRLFSPPMEITFDPWVKAWDTACTGLHCEGLKVGFWNSIQILIPSVVLSTVIASINGYGLANWRFKGSEVFFTILLFGGFIPYQVLLYPVVMVLKNLHLFGTLPGIILVHTIFGMPINTLLFRNYFTSMPNELFKAGRVDGAGFWRIFFEIMLPMSLPIYAVAFVIQVTGIWNDFLFGVIYSGRDNWPMTVQLNNIVNSNFGVKEYNVNMAATMLTAVLPLTVYFFSGKLFVRGIASGAVKG
jgi:glucose/mannose transport system permease protein